MRMKTKYLVSLLAAAIVAGGLLIAHAANPDRSPGLGGHGPLLPRLARKLALTGDQRQQIKAVLVADKDPIISVLTRLHDAHKQLREAIEADHATADSVRAAAAQVAAVEADLAVERLKLHDQIVPLLTPDQKLKVVVLEDQFDTFLDGVIAKISAGLSK